jgi:hypothetical protein
MNLKNPLALFGTAGALGLLVALSAPSGASAQNAAPVAESQVPGAPPSPAYVWMSGQWNMEAGQWRWVGAHWELPPSRSAIWIGGHWAPVGGNWVWVNGAWNISDSLQSQAMPPQPPPAPMPVPSSPPPLLSNAYGNEGTDPAVPLTTDYGPIDYAASYPGNYWSGDPYWSSYPWDWGYPGAYLGLGWGPAYFGYYRGGRGYWGHGYGSGGYSRGGRGGAAPMRGGYAGHAGAVHAGGQAGGSRR